MKLLLDTNALIFALTNPQRLTKRAHAVMRDPDTDLLISHISLWEIGVKMSKGKLTDLGSSLFHVLEEINVLDIELLPVTLEHILRLERLEPVHRDPFDRLLIAQALVEDLPIITSDKDFAAYGVRLFR